MKSSPCRESRSGAATVPRSRRLPGPMIFQLAEAYYKVPNLYNNLLEHVVIAGQDPRRRSRQAVRFSVHL